MFISIYRFSSIEVSRTVDEAQKLLAKQLAQEKEILFSIDNHKVNDQDDVAFNPEWTLLQSAEGRSLGDEARNITLTALLAEEATRLLVKR